MRKNPYIDIINANGHDFVEIGGVKWATCNVGAEKPWESGLYFQWGDTQGYSAEDIIQGKKNYSWRNYKFGYYNVVHKYCKNDEKVSLDLEDDAARYYMGGKWRIPTIEDFIQLNETAKIQWTGNFNGTCIRGMTFTSLDDPSKVLFFPAQGYADDHSICANETHGLYWARKKSDRSDCGASSLHFSIAMEFLEGFYDRKYGFAIRGILC